MSAEAAIDRRPLHRVSEADKLRRAISSLRQDDGTELVVSRYGDAVWDFWPAIPAGNLVPSEKRLNWALSLPDGRTLLDPEHSVLLASAKDFIYSLLLDPVEGRRPPKAQTLVKKHRKGLAPLLRWMVRNGYRRFGDVVDLEPYVVYAKAGSGRPGRTPTAKTVGCNLPSSPTAWPSTRGPGSLRPRWPGCPDAVVASQRPPTYRMT